MKCVDGSIRAVIIEKQQRSRPGEVMISSTLVADKGAVLGKQRDARFSTDHGKCEVYFGENIFPDVCRHVI